jgi:hypothetical protein
VGWTLGPYTVLGGVILARDEFFHGRWRLGDLLPAWPLSVWIAIGLGWLFVLALEGSLEHTGKIAKDNERDLETLRQKARDKANLKAVELFFPMIGSLLNELSQVCQEWELHTGSDLKKPLSDVVLNGLVNKSGSWEEWQKRHYTFHWRYRWYHAIQGHAALPITTTLPLAPCPSDASCQDVLAGMRQHSYALEVYASAVRKDLSVNPTI